MKFDVSTWVGGRRIEFQKPISDPFVRHTVVIGWRDCLRGIWKRGGLEVVVIVGGDQETVRRVMRNGT